MSNDVIVQLITTYLSVSVRIAVEIYRLPLCNVRIIAAAGTASLLSLVPSDLHIRHRYLKQNIPKTVEKIKQQKLFQKWLFYVE